jgi:peptidoglycan hydrolase CwlO-like protein
MAPASRITARGIAATALAAVAVTLVPAGAGADVSGRLDTQRAREERLQGQVNTFSTLVNRLDGDISAMRGEEQKLQSVLDVRQAALDRTQRTLRAERRRLALLKARLATAQRLLSARLVEIYKSGRPDIVTVILTSDGFSQLLERGEFIRRISEQDQRIVLGVRRARAQVAVVAARLAVLEVRQRKQAEVIRAQRDKVAENRAVLDRKRAGVASARAGAAASLHATAARRRALEKQLAKLQQTQPDAGSLPLGSTQWAIPAWVVQCESGGRNTGPNFVGASGYYQIIPSTWQGAGGQGPAAYLAPKSEQDRIASILWNHGLGAVNWDCYTGRR